MKQLSINQKVKRVYERIHAANPRYKKADFAEDLGVSPQVITEIFGDRMRVSVDVLQNIFEKLGVGYEEIFKTDAGSPAVSGVKSVRRGDETQKTGSIGASFVPKNVPFLSPLAEKSNVVNEPGQVYNLGMPKVVTIDSRGKDNVAHVPVKARAGYLSGYGDPEYISHLQGYHLPGLKHGTFRSFEVQGQSMVPTIRDKDWVVGEWVENIEDIRESRVYIVVTRNDGILIKRVVNRIKQLGTLFLKSDNVTERGKYPAIAIAPEDVLELWYSRIKISPDLSDPGQVYERLNNLELAMEEVTRRLGIEPFPEIEP